MIAPGAQPSRYPARATPGLRPLCARRGNKEPGTKHLAPAATAARGCYARPARGAELFRNLRGETGFPGEQFPEARLRGRGGRGRTATLEFGLAEDRPTLLPSGQILPSHPCAPNSLTHKKFLNVFFFLSFLQSFLLAAPSPSTS